MLVKNIMFKDISSLADSALVQHAVKTLLRQHRESLPVVNRQNKYLGMLSVADILNAVLPEHYQLLQDLTFVPDSEKLVEELKKVNLQKVKALMRVDLPTLDEADTALHAVNIMISRGIDSIAVVRQGKLAGVVNRIDCLASLSGSLDQ